ncbi:hypothetical protein B0H14DRAFT_2767533 [Mycena olivaceomarginata]|nr:hypothetical protein B0H14DRAFT_2767533 [Mycena olivaceomarginata]
MSCWQPAHRAPRARARPRCTSRRGHTRRSAARGTPQTCSGATSRCKSGAFGRGRSCLCPRGPRRSPARRHGRRQGWRRRRRGIRLRMAAPMRRGTKMRREMRTMRTKLRTAPIPRPGPGMTSTWASPRPPPRTSRTSTTRRASPCSRSEGKNCKRRRRRIKRMMKRRRRMHMGV